MKDKPLRLTFIQLLDLLAQRRSLTRLEQKELLSFLEDTSKNQEDNIPES